MNTYIPLTLNKIINEPNIYLYLRFLRELTITQFYDFNKDTKNILVINYMDDRAEKITACYRKIGVSRQTWYKNCKGYAKLIKIVDEPVVMMPYAVFDSIIAKIDKLPMKSRAAMLRVYLYVYYCDTFYGGEFQQSQSQMAKELNTSLSYVNRALKKFIEWGWLIRSGKYRFSGENTFSYKHTVPESMKCGEIFHLIDENIPEFY